MKPSYTVVRHPSGKRQIVGINDRQVITSNKLAQSVDVAPSSASKILQGETVKGWHIEKMQRRRENMRISFRLTKAGKAYAEHAQGAFGMLLRVCENGEASDVSEAMLQAGYETHTRDRVLIDAARARSKGLLEVVRQSGAIFGNV